MCTESTITIARQRITQPGQLGLGYTVEDGLGLWQPHEYLVEDCIIDLSGWPLNALDEAVAVTWGASAIFRRCVIRGAGKLVLCGSGDAARATAEAGRTVTFEDCILEGFGRRGVEAQAGMRVILHSCLIRNWGCPSRHIVRDFAAWAHRGGRIDAVGSAWWQDSFARPWHQAWADWTAHIGQAWNDEGWRGLLRPAAWLPGVCRGLLATDGGAVSARRCWKNHWWIVLPAGDAAPMGKADALWLVGELEAMAARLAVAVGESSGLADNDAVDGCSARGLADNQRDGTLSHAG